MLNLYLVTQDYNTNYDQYLGMVVAAESEYHARHIHPSEEYYRWNFEEMYWEFVYSDRTVRKADKHHSWVQPEQTICKKIGQANPSIIKPTVLIADFRAG